MNGTRTNDSRPLDNMAPLADKYSDGYIYNGCDYSNMR